MERVVITGGGGFIGSHLASFLRAKGYWVRVVDIDFPEIRREWWGQANQRMQLDLRSTENCDKAISGVDWVFHLAADMGGVGYFTAHDYYPYINNQQINLNVLRSCEECGVKRLFFSSSACIYPTHLQKDVHHPFIASEEDIFPANSDQMYGWDKLMMTMLCERSPLDARVGIFHTIYGEGQEWDGERAKFPPTIVRKVLESKKTGSIKIWGDGSQLRTYLYINDALEKIYEIMSANYSGPVNVAGDELISVTDTARLVCDITDNFMLTEYEGEKPTGVLARGADQTKWDTIYQYRNRYSLREGFSRLAIWVKMMLDKTGKSDT